MSEAAPFRPGLVIGLVVAGLVSFAAFIFLLGWGGLDGEQSHTRGAPPGTSAVGFKGLIELTDRYVDTRNVDEDSDLDTWNLLVVALDRSDDRSEVSDLLRRRRGQPTVLILPKWTVTPDREHPGWVRGLGPYEDAAAERLMGRGVSVRPVRTPNAAQLQTESFDALEDLAIPIPDRPQVIDGEGLTRLVQIRGEGALVAQFGREPHYVVADPDLLNNMAMRDPRRAQLAVRMLSSLLPDEDGLIYFDAGLGSAGGDRSLIRTMFEPPFLAMTIALIVATLLAGLHGAVRFGPARAAGRAIPFGKAALVENSAGLLRLARREVSVGASYADVVRDEAARTGAAPPNLQGEELEAYLDRFTRPGDPPFRALAYDVRAARDRVRMVEAARALFRWKKDMIR